MHFQLLTGKYEHSDGKLYKAGDIIETDVDLNKKWINKFKHVVPVPGVGMVPPAAVIQGTTPTVAPVEPPAPNSKKARLSAAAADALAARGTDVTTQFPATAAHPEGFKVFQRADLFAVFVGDEVKPIAQGLKKDAVDAAVEKYLG